MEKSPVFGGKCTDLLVRFDRESLCWRMWLPLFTMDSAPYQDRWPKSGMISNGRLYQLNNLELHTSGGDGLVLPTPTAQRYGYNKSKSKGAKKRASLETMARNGDLILATPTANEAKNNPTGASVWTRKSLLNVEAAKLDGYTQKTTGPNLRLNPHFVTWMMGFPTGWLDLEP